MAVNPVDGSREPAQRSATATEPSTDQGSAEPVPVPTAVTVAPMHASSTAHTAAPL